MNLYLSMIMVFHLDRMLQASLNVTITDWINGNEGR